MAGTRKLAEGIASAAHTSERVFLGWDRPVLESAVEKLRERFQQGDNWDLREMRIVLPSALAARRLQELLAHQAQEVGLVLYPPKIHTIGQLPERLYRAKLPFASEFVQHLAWMQALQDTDAARLKHLIPVPPPSGATGQWLELAKTIAQLHRELASEKMSFSEVVKRLPERHVEVARWRCLSAVQTRYLEVLDSLGLWDVQSARLYALEHEEPQTYRFARRQQVIAIGCVDLNEVQKGFLSAIAAQVEIWVAAPDDQHRSFDEYGCLRQEVWQEQVLPFAADSILVGNSPQDQAELAAGCLAEFAEDYDRSHITLGLPDTALLPELRHRLDLCDVATRYGPGDTLARSEPLGLLSLIGKFVENRSYSNFSALLRHPAVNNLLSRQAKHLPEDWLAQLDAYHQGCLPKQVSKFVDPKAPGSQVYKQLVKTIDKWLGKLPKKSQPVSKLVQPLLQVLRVAYDRVFCNLEEADEANLYAASEVVASSIIELRDVPKQLQPELTIAELIDWLVPSLGARRVAEAPNPESVEILGWLDLALDDAPALVVAGVHDGVVPESVNADPFLPNNLRKQLQLADNDRRLARDIYAARVMLESRKSVRFIAGKINASGDPLTPSRLLLACELSELPARVLHLSGEEHADVLSPVAERWQASARSKPQLEIPPPDTSLRPEHLTVTAFRDYLACPYRYYLRHVLRLKGIDDSLSEMQASQFGVLIHDALDKLVGPMGSCTDPEQICEFLLGHLEEDVDRKFGDSPAAPLLIQIEQARMRLEAFAHQQAERAQEGWQIRWTEQGVDDNDDLRIGKNDEFRLVGRIDRIDYHPDSKQWAIWDYKTSETAKDPVKVHWSDTNGWQDLQLPLYRHLAKRMDVHTEPILGYIVLPKQASQTRFCVADFTPEQLRDADFKADEIVSRIAAGEFWPEEWEAPVFDDYARICQTNIREITSQQPQRKQNRYLETEAGTVSPDVVQEAKILNLQPEISDPELTPVLIRASAGTGKTFQLSNRLLQVILSGQSVDTVLASTFTRKAAGEILQRVMERLAKACLSEEARSELEKHVEGVDASPASCLAALRRVTQQVHRFRISTLDSFFSSVARVFSFEMGLPNGWEPMDPVQERTYQLQAVSNLLEKEDKQTLINLVRMLAKGESSRRVADEILQTVRSGFSVYRVADEPAWDQLPLMPPVSEAAFESALQAVENCRLGHKSIDQQIEKFHLAARTGDWEDVLAHKLVELAEEREPTYYRKTLPADLMFAVQQIADRAASELLPIRKAQTLASYEVLDKYNTHYQDILRKYRLLAFADVTYHLSQWSSQGLATQSELVERLEFRLDCGIRHLLLDEFQDTSAEQWRILEPIAKPLASPRGAQSERSILCVGDAKQAIYGWRGGVAEVFDAVTGALPSIEQKELSQSFRSSNEVIQSVNEVFSHLSLHDNYANCEVAAGKWSKAFPEHATARRDLKGFVQLQNGPQMGGATFDEIRSAYMLEAAQEISHIIEQSSASVGVLLRTNASVAQMIATLRDLGVSASQDGGNPLTDSVAVELILSLVHLADHPGDKICHYHIDRSPLAEYLPVDTSDAAKLSNWFRTQVYRLGLGRAVRRIADSLAAHVSWWDQYRLEQLLQMAHEYESGFSGRLSDFEQAVETKQVSLPTEAQVKVMTIHRSKGLEFDAVFLPDLSCALYDGSSAFVLRGDDPCQPPNGVVRYMNSALQRFLPQDWQSAFEQNKERQVVESLCLLYVAMTRARRALYMYSRPRSKQSRQDFAGILQATLVQSGKQASNADEVLYQRGDKDWFSALPAIKEEPEAVEARDIKLRSDPELAERRSLKVTAPSYESHQNEPVSIGDLFALSQSHGAVYGRILHSLLENVHWLEKFAFDRETMLGAVQSRLTAEELQLVSLDQVLDEFEETLQLGSTRAALSKSRYGTKHFGRIPDRVEISNELSVSQLIDGELISGQIDRLAVLYKDEKPYAAEIFDYKAEHFDPEMTLLWLDDRVEQHRPQMQAYARAVGKMLGLKPSRVRSYLLMLSTDDLVPVDTAIPSPHFDSSASKKGEHVN